MLLSYSQILAEAMSIASTSLQQRQSISLALFLQCLHFRSGRLELFCKNVVVKNVPKLTGVYSGTGVSCDFLRKFKEHLFSQNTFSGCFWHLHQSRFPILIMYVINWHLRREYVQFLPMAQNGRAKDLIFISIYLRIITFFIKI